MQLKGIATEVHEYRNRNIAGMAALGVDVAGFATDAKVDVYAALRAIGTGEAGSQRMADQFTEALKRAQAAAEAVHYSTDALESIMSGINSLIRNRTGETIF